ncbi:MAG: hypothetical protein U1F35_21040 [Steroidobacteraceae bacterium]
MLVRRRPALHPRPAGLIDEELLAEVTALVEWPVPIAGRWCSSPCLLVVISTVSITSATSRCRPAMAG